MQWALQGPNIISYIPRGIYIGHDTISKYSELLGPLTLRTAAATQVCALAACLTEYVSQITPSARK